MGWSEHRVEEYRHGRPATWIECRMLEHAQPVHLLLAIFATAGLGYGLWTHEWPWIAGGAALGVAGHICGWLWRPGRARLPSGPVAH